MRPHAATNQINTLKNFFINILSGFKWHITGWIIAVSIWALDSSIRAYVLRMIINSIGPDLTRATQNKILFPIMIYGAITVGLILITRFYNWIVLKVTPELKKKISSSMIEYVTGHSNELLLEQMTGSLSNRINDVVYGTPAILVDIIDGLYFYGITMIFTIITVWQVDFKFAIAISIWITSVLIITFSFLQKSKNLSAQTYEEWTNVAGKIVDIVSNIMNIRFFARRNYEQELLSQSLSSAVTIEQRKNIFFLKLYSIQSASFILLQFICLWMLVNGLFSGKTTAGDFSLILSLNTTVSDSLYNISKSFLTFTENLGKVSQGLKITKNPVPLLPASSINREALIVTAGKIEFEKVCFSYNGSSQIFYNKTLTIRAGQKIGLSGHSGSGKSTFINLILRMFNIQSGRILIDGQDIANATTESICNSIAVIPQDPPLFHRSIKENIRYGKLDASDEQIIDAAKKAHAHDFIKKLSEGYDSLVGNRGVKLSGGQKQRIAITRAILKDAPIFILDEATSGLDSMTESLVQENIWEIAKDKTTIVIAHRLKTLIDMDKILVFDQGVIVEEGTHAELISQNGLYKKQWDAQTKPS
jgi:ATP-binding cassette subfamily B protein